MLRVINIGVFDSGKGGQSVATAIAHALPNATVNFVSDVAHLPYGNKTPDQLYELVLPILQDLAAQNDVIVIACNTVSTTLRERLREVITRPIIALDPMVKPAAQQTKSGVIAVCATPTTLASQRYQDLKRDFAQGITVVEPDCSDWTTMIEANQVDRQQISQRIEAVCRVGADMIVLGCTHYHWIEDLINEIAAGRATVLQPEQAIIKRLKTVISEL